MKEKIILLEFTFLRYFYCTVRYLFWRNFFLKGYYTPNLKLVFVCYLKIINTFMKNDTSCILSKLSKELKNVIEILVAQGV